MSDNRLELGASGGAIDSKSEPPAVVPAQGGWVPPPWLPVVFVAIGGALASALPFVSGPWAIAVNVGIGIMAAVGGALGMQSAGPRKN